jgi:DNA-binding transcriptional regulator/RsmH inhibitor MraZ
VGLPARFAAVLERVSGKDSDQLGLVLTPERSIKLTPIPLFNQELGRWLELNDQVDEERLVLNLSASLAERVTLDKQKRFKLSATMIEVCQIQRDVMIVGSLRTMQLYAVDVWREMIARNLPQMGAASTKVALKGEPQAPVQYVIQAVPTTEPGGAKRPR